MRTNVVAAIFKRNFVAYFSSPIGYVFICALVLLSAFAAFWPNAFFNANLANLDQLNRLLPWIMLVFVPAVTMSTWALEREHGTDELLLTLPARDIDVVIGKYLAALAIFTVALVFSLSNVVVLIGLGEPDLGLLLANYVGYWLVGAAMIAIGMVASFLTGNLTVAFILAVAFNAPLVFANYADVIHGRELTIFLRQFGIASQFADFGSGVISLSSVVYFAAIIVVMLYVCVALIRRRLWSGRSTPMGLHYTVRALCLIGMAVGIAVLATRFDRRVDATSERLSSLSSQTESLLSQLSAEQPVFIEAYISDTVPEQYVQTRANLLNMLREVNRLAGDRIVVRINSTEPYSEQAAEAAEQFGIGPRQVQSSTGGKLSVESVFMGAAFMSGLDKVVVPFFDLGTPVEYEVVRSIATVAQRERQRIGVVTTDARLFGGFDMASMSSRPSEQIINELNKQFETEQVNANQAIPDGFDALLVVQPSSLPQAQLDNVIAAIRRGVPTAIFEDPFPVRDPNVAPTSQPRVPPGGNNPFMQQQPPEPKGDMRTLWDLLQVDFSGTEVVWEDYNPYPKLPELPAELVFIGHGSGAVTPFNEGDDITSGLQQVLLMFGGYYTPRPGSPLVFEPLLTTGSQTGVIPCDQLVQRSIFGGVGGLNPNRRPAITRTPYAMAARITGTPADAGEGDGPLNVVVAGDIDMLYSIFFVLRDRGGNQDEVALDFDNVAFVLNTLDVLAGDTRFVDIRKRRPKHRTLTAVERRTQGIVDRANAEAERFRNDFEQEQQRVRAEFDTRIAELQNREGIDIQQMALELQAAMQANERQLAAAIERLERERDREIQKTEQQLATEIRGIQGRFKLAAVLLPPLLPLILAIIVFARRRSLEKIGVPKERLRAAGA